MRWIFCGKTSGPSLARRVKAGVVGGAMCLAGLSGCGQFDSAPEFRPYEDQLGPDSGESIDSYVARTPFTAPEAPTWAMVTFTQPLPFAEAARFAQSYAPERVNQLVFPDRAPGTVPEPSDYASREKLFELYGRLAGAEAVSGLVVRADPVALTGMNEDSRAFHVEALPPDATWGFIGVRPVRL